jgi:hypothetical protein
MVIDSLKQLSKEGRIEPAIDVNFEVSRVGKIVVFLLTSSRQSELI